MKRITLVVLAALALLGIAAAGLLAAGCGSSSGGDVPSDAVATVGDVSIAKAQLQQLLDQAKTQQTASGSAFPKEGSTEYDQYVAQIVQYLVQAQIVEQSAKELGVTVSDKEVNDQVAQIEKAYGGEKKVVELLKQQGMTMELLRLSLRNQLLSQKAAAKVTKDAKVTDADVKAYWDSHKDELQKDPKTATFAKAKATVKSNLLTSAQQQLWSKWLVGREKALGVAYAAGFDPKQLAHAAASVSPSASANGG